MLCDESLFLPSRGRPFDGEHTEESHPGIGTLSRKELNQWSESARLSFCQQSGPNRRSY